MELYHARDFGKAARLFAEVERLLPDDFPSGLLRKRCETYTKNPRRPTGMAWRS